LSPGSSGVERFLGKEEVGSSILLPGSRQNYKNMREIIHLQCTECKRKNYSTTKNKKNNPAKVELKKYCSFDRKHTLHKEVKK
jgi:large subunit ribosomal protein L33